MKLGITLAFLGLICVLNAEHICPHCCDCFGDGYVACYNCNYTEVPQNLASNITSLYLDGNRITQVKESDLSYLTNLSTFSLDSNGISDDGFTPSTFKTVDRVQGLSLNGNKLRSISIYFPQSLTSLDLGSNEIKEVEAGDLNAYSSLDSITLSYNQIYQIPEYFFAYNSLLTHIYLQGNRISYIEGVTFSKQTNLSYLDLRGNVIESIQSAAFSSQRHLTMLLLDNNRLTSKVLNNLYLGNLVGIRNFSLAGNPITDVPFNLPQNTVYLVLGNTSITTIYPGAFHGLDKLEYLFLNNLQMLHIEPGAFTGLDLLQNLDMSHSVLSPGVLSPGMLSGLKNLWIFGLFNASIGAIEVGAFEDSPKLWRLQMFNNKLSTLHPDVINGTQMGEMWLSQNPFWCDCNLKWLKISSANQGPPYINSPYNMECAGPDSVRGMMFNDLSPDDFRCT